MMVDDGLGDLLAEQVAYYRARAPEYLGGALDLPGGAELEAALHTFRPTGEVLELAIAAERVGEQARVRFVCADLFEWRPDRRYDVVFFGFWLSHVPLERFAAFWALVDDCLAPGGRVFFADDAYRTPDELVEGAASSTIRRRLSDGTAYRAVKVPHTTRELEARLRHLGWDITVSTAVGPCFWGEGGRA